jgi:hypothetical protein
MATFTLKGEIPTRLVEEFMQLIRDFEQGSPNEIHIAMVFDVPELSVKEVQMMFDNIGPSFAYTHFFPRRKPS